VVFENIINYFVCVLHILGVNFLVLFGEFLLDIFLRNWVYVVNAVDELVDGVAFLYILREIVEELRQL